MKKNKFDLSDTLAIIGLGVFSVGVWQVYQPAAYIAAGVVIFLIGIMGSRS